MNGVEGAERCGEGLGCPTQHRPADVHHLDLGNSTRTEPRDDAGTIERSPYGQAQRQVPRLAAIGIGVAVSGAFVVTGGDLQVSGRAFGGDVLAVLGGITAAAYVTVSAEARKALSANVHTAICFASAAALLLIIAIVARTPLVGFSRATWGWILALTVGAQLLGHAVFNIVLKTTSATVVSVSILFEIVGASLLAWAWFDERPPLRFVPAAVLVAAGAVLVVRAGRVRRRDW